MFPHHLPYRHGHAPQTNLFCRECNEPRLPHPVTARGLVCRCDEPPTATLPAVRPWRRRYDPTSILAWSLALVGSAGVVAAIVAAVQVARGVWF